MNKYDLGMQSLKAILAEHCAETVAGLARNAYKYTSCGAALGALVEAGEDNSGRWIYGSGLNDIKPETYVMALSVSSIVEGVEQTTETHIIDLAEPNAAAAYNAALEAVEKEADEIWKQTHGCQTCAKHWGNAGEFGAIEGDDGMTPVWGECPDCHGQGSVI